MHIDYMQKNRNRKRWSEKSPTAHRKVVPMSVVRPVPLNQLQPGTVVWAHIPFADGTGEKARPAVVRSTHGREIELLPATTSAARFNAPGYSQIIDLDTAGLHRRTTVRHRTVTVDRIEIINITGRVAAHDADQLGLPTPDLAWGGDDAA